MRHIDLSLSSVVDRLLNEDLVTQKNPKPVGNHYSSVLDRIKSAIKFRRYIHLNYDDHKGDRFTKRNPDGTPKWGNPRAYRRIIPYALYYSNQNGKLTLRCFHASNNHTKRGPQRWKEFIVDNMKNVRITNNEFTEEDLPDNMNRNGDKHAAQMVMMVDFNNNPYEPQEEFMSPVERERERMRRMENGESYDELYTNQGGPVQNQPVPNIKKGRNLKTMQNLGKPGKIDYKKAYDAFKQSNARNTFRDWDAAEAERRDQQSQQQRPITAQQNTSGPVATRQQQPQIQNVNNDEENWDEYLNRPNNNNF